MEPHDFLEIFSRKKWLIIFSILLILFGATLYCVVIPDKYRSSVTILVIPPSVSETFVRSAVDYEVESRISGIQQRVLTRKRMVGVIDELGLFPKERNKSTPEALVDKMEKRMDIKIIRGKNAFRLSFAHENPKKAALTTSKLASFFIEENQRTREETAVGTTEFLETQLRETKAKLEEQEEKVKRYKLTYMGELPQQMEVNLNLLGRLQDREKSLTEAVARAEDRRIFLETEISKQLSQGLASKNPIDSLLESLAEKRKQLQDLTARYTESYPTIIQLRNEIEQLEAKLVSLQKAERPDAVGTSGTAAGDRTPPQGFRLESAEVRRLRGQVTALNLEIKALQREKEENRTAMRTVESKVGRLPQREQELVSLTRDYENLKRSYDELLKKKLEAGISRNLEENQKSEQFQILEPPSMPTTPFEPDRKRILSLAFLGAIAFGFGGAIGLEILDPTLRGAKEFKYFYDIPVLAAFPTIRDGGRIDRSNARKAAILAGIATLAFAATVGLLLYQDRIRAILKLTWSGE